MRTRVARSHTPVHTYRVDAQWFTRLCFSSVASRNQITFGVVSVTSQRHKVQSRDAIVPLLMLTNLRYNL